MQVPAQKFPNVQKIIFPTKFLLSKAQVQVGDRPGLLGREEKGSWGLGGERQGAQEEHPRPGEGEGEGSQITGELRCLREARGLLGT